MTTGSSTRSETSSRSRRRQRDQHVQGPGARPARRPPRHRRACCCPCSPPPPRSWWSPVSCPPHSAVMGIVGQPLLFVILGIVLVLFSVGYAEMSRHVHNAGAFYAYISRGLGGTAGAGASLRRARRLQRPAGRHLRHLRLRGLRASSPPTSTSNVAWWIPALVAVAVVGVLGWLKIDLNARVLGVLLVIEVALVVIFDIAAVADPAKEGLSLHAFNPDTLTGAGRRHRPVLLHRRLRRLRTGPRVRRGDQPPADRRRRA